MRSTRSRLTLLGLTTSLLAGTAGGALAATPSQTAAGWVATHTQALHLKAVSLGAAPATKTMHVSVALPVRDKADMTSLVTELSDPASSLHGKFLTPAQVAERFGPSASTVAAVEHYLSANGMTAVSAEPDGLLVDATGSVAQIDRAFHTAIGLFRLNGSLVYANTAAASVPSALGKDVLAVLGLSDTPMQLPHVVRTAAGSPDLTGFSPTAVERAYDAISMPAATGTSTSIIAAGNLAPIIQNLRIAEKAWHFPQVPVTVVYGGPEAAIVNDNPLTGNLEWDLDTQISTMVARAVKRLYIYDIGTFTDADVARGINLFVERHQATALSASLGECDYIAFLDGAMVTTDEALMEGAIQGQSMFASTGDNGYACPEVASTGVPEGPPGASWPADGQYTTGVGGTTLIADSDGNVSDEIAWIGGGGGISPWETAPSWTLRANGAGQSWQYTNQGGRSVPDVAAVADQFTPVLIYGGGNTPTAVGGTSVSSPLTMGLWARIQNVHADRLGLASYDFYRLYNAVNPGTVEETPVGIPVYAPSSNPGAVAGFRDITIGTNGLYVATPGYDYTTGIGSLQAAILARKL